jgi:geranylgeranyl diphosphate synthase type II
LHEFFHNAFLVHDDVEDESLHRRGAPTMHQDGGVAIAVNVGDALNVLAMTPLLRNLEVVGLEKTLRIFREIEQMARESVEGQAMELEWVRANTWELRDAHYFRMTSKKTCWYTTIAPCRLGALVGGPLEVDLEPWIHFGYQLGVAFQIQDDLLNLVGEEERYGKETAGDIWEGKRTLMLIQLLQRARGGSGSACCASWGRRAPARHSRMSTSCSPRWNATARSTTRARSRATSPARHAPRSPRSPPRSPHHRTWTSWSR